jgi:hypothetical protein
MNECYDSIRFSLSDLSGRMQFESFDIAHTPECRRAAASIRNYLLHRPLAEVDVGRIRSMERDGTCPCVAQAARLVREQQRLFGRTDRPGRTQVK